jgi:hypothetical protein
VLHPVNSSILVGRTIITFKNTKNCQWALSYQNMWKNLTIILYCYTWYCNYLKAGLSNVRPAGHIRPAKHFNVACKHFLDSPLKIICLINNIKLQLFKKMKCKNTFSPHLMLKFNPYVSDTGLRRPNMLPMWPSRQNELPTYHCSKVSL